MMGGWVDGSVEKLTMTYLYWRCWYDSMWQQWHWWWLACVSMTVTIHTQIPSTCSHVSRTFCCSSSRASRSTWRWCTRRWDRCCWCWETTAVSPSTSSTSSPVSHSSSQTPSTRSCVSSSWWVTHLVSRTLTFIMYQHVGNGGRTLERRTVNRGDDGSIPPFRNLGNFIHAIFACVLCNL